MKNSIYLRAGAATLLTMMLMTTGAMAQVQSKGLATKLMPARSQGPVPVEQSTRGEIKKQGCACCEVTQSTRPGKVSKRGAEVKTSAGQSCVGCEPKQASNS